MNDRRGGRGGPRRTERRAPGTRATRRAGSSPRLSQGARSTNEATIGVMPAAASAIPVTRSVEVAPSRSASTRRKATAPATPGTVAIEPTSMIKTMPTGRTSGHPTAAMTRPRATLARASSRLAQRSRCSARTVDAVPARTSARRRLASGQATRESTTGTTAPEAMTGRRLSGAVTAARSGSRRLARAPRSRGVGPSSRPTTTMPLESQSAMGEPPTASPTGGAAAQATHPAARAASIVAAASRVRRRPFTGRP